MMIRAAQLTARVCLTTLGVLLILVALLSAGVRLGLPMMAGYKGEIETRVSQYLRSPVEIGDLSLRWEGFGPLLLAERVAVFESAERQVTLDELLIDLNLAKSLLRGVPVINELTLVGASLAIEARADGQFRLHGMERVRSGAGAVTAEAGEKGKGVDVVAWLLTASKVGLLDTEVTFIDMQADQRLVIEDLNIRAENKADVHQLRVDLRLPEEMGGSLEAGIDLFGTAGSLASSDGKLYLKADRLRLQAMLGLLHRTSLIALPEIGLDTSVSMEIWGQWADGRLVSAHGPVSTSTVVASSTGATLLDSLGANMTFSVTDNGNNLVASDIGLQTGVASTRIEYVSGSWQIGVSSASTPASWTVAASGKKLDLSPVSAIIQGMIAVTAPDVSAILQQSNIAGQLQDWQMEMRNHAGSPVVDMVADINRFHSQPTAAAPGFGPVSGHVNVIDSRGELTFAADTMPFSWPAMLGEGNSSSIDAVKAVLDFDFSDWERLRLDGDLELQDDQISVSTRLQALLEAGQSPHLDLQSRFSAGDLTALKQWLPRKKLGPGFQAWVDRAIDGGVLTDGSLLFFGKMDEFPFSEGEGVFRASADITQGDLSFLPHWPSLTDITAEFELTGLTLTGAVQQGAHIDEFTLSQADIRIENLMAPVLMLKSTGQGALQSMIDFANTGPLSRFLRPVLADVAGTGAAEMDLSLTVPLYRKQPPEGGGENSAVIRAMDPKKGSNSAQAVFNVGGSIFLSGNSIRLGMANIALKDVQGAVAFDSNGIRINNLKARLLDQPVSVSAITLGESSAATTHVTVNGALKGSDVLAHYGNPLDQFLRGASSWSVKLSAPHSATRLASEGVQLAISSDLVGTEIKLPLPLYKSSGDARGFHLETVFIDGRKQQWWNIDLDNSAQIHAKVSSRALESLIINLGDKTLSAAELGDTTAGIRLQGTAGRVAADQWAESITQLIDSFPVEQDGPKPMIPMSVELDIASFEVGNSSLGAAKLRMESDEDYLTVLIANTFIEGTVHYPRQYWSKTLPVKANIAHLDLAAIKALSLPGADAKQSAVAALDPRLLPPIEARIASFRVGSNTVRDLVARAQPDISGLKFNTLGFAYQSMQLVGQGYWRLRDPQGINPKLADQHMTQLELVLQSDNFGEGLSYIGFDGVLSEGEGTVEMQFAWPGPAYLPDLSELDGSVRVAIDKGSIIPLEPGAGRIVGLFALQSLPRRLNLDFKDISADGLAFNRISGEAEIDKGIVDVSLVQLNGPIGVVDVVGKVDLNSRAFDQRITVLPRVSAALPIIGIISGGASAGVGALVAAGLLKALGIDLDRIGLRDYSLTGSWDDPVFKPVETDYRRDR